MPIPANLPFARQQAIDLFAHQIGCASGSVRNALVAKAAHPLGEVPSQIYIPGLLRDGLREEINPRDPWISPIGDTQALHDRLAIDRSEEHTSELQSLMRISYAFFCLNKP